MIKKYSLFFKSIGLFIFLVGITYSVLYFYYVPQLIDAKNNYVHSIDPKVENSSPSKTEIKRHGPPPWHNELLIADLHADTLLWNRDLMKRSDRGHVDIPRMVEGNIGLQGFSMVTQTPPKISYQGNANGKDNIIWLAIFQSWPFSSWFNLSKRAFHQIDRLSAAVRASDQFFLIRNKSDLENYLQLRLRYQSSKSPDQKKITAGFLALEGAQSLTANVENPSTTESRKQLMNEILQQYYEAGVRMISPAHLTDNFIGGSQQGMEKYGLTDLGFEWLKKMNDLHMIIDLAHASEKVISDVLEKSSSPVVVSHTGVKGTCDNNRNLSDEQIRAIAAKGGLIGIGFWEGATCGKTVDDIVKAILYVKNLVGIQHVALASDWDGFVSTPFDASGVGQLSGALADAGLSQAEVAQIMGGNVFEFLLKNLPPH